jgi:predicted site-specific integrase-resolvase
MTVRHLNQIELARRWNISARTLERWRWLGEGPVYLKLGGRVSYRLEDVEHYEAIHLHANTNGPLHTEKMNGQPEH